MFYRLSKKFHVRMTEFESYFSKDSMRLICVYTGLYVKRRAGYNNLHRYFSSSSHLK